MTTTIFDLLKNQEYTQKGILEKIILHTIQTSREDMITNMDRIITESEEKTIKEQYYAYTEEKKPLEYIFGYCEFLERKFKVSPDTLMPRPETEYMILSVNRFLSDKKNIVLCDIGTGCGVLGISTLCDNKDQIFKGYLTEISPAALSIARQNRDFFSQHEHINHDKVCFLESNIIDFMSEQKTLSDLQKADTICIIGNLPYIPLQTFDENVEDSVKLREPKFAFVGGEDGCDRYRVMLNDYLKHPVFETLKHKTHFFLEMMTRQKQVLEKEYGDLFSFAICETFHFNIIIVHCFPK